MRIIPAIDIMNGKCVRLTKGDFSTQKIYNENPLEIALRFEDFGFQYLHVVDLDGAKSNTIVNHKTLFEIATKTNLKVDFGGGLKTTSDLQIAFESGASQITAGSTAVKNRTLVLEWIASYGAEKIILGADCFEGKIVTNGWLEQSELDVIDFINEYKAHGIQSVVCTDVAKDGMLQGPSFELYETIVKKTNLKCIASGGVSSLDDLLKLRHMGCEGAIVGKALYESKINLKDLSALC